MFSILWGCNPDDESTPSETLIIDGLIYMGQTVEVDLSLLAPLNSPRRPYTDAPAIAIVSQQKEEFPLFPIPDLPGRYRDPVNQIPLPPGDSLIIFVPFQDTAVVAATVMPFPPDNMALDRAIIPLNAFDLQTDNADTLRWSNTEERHFAGKLSLVNINPVKIISTEADPPTEFILSATSGDRYAIPHKSLRYYGLYQLVLYAVNLEYAQFFASDVQSQVQQSTNIMNGLGLFTAINSDTSYFFVTPR